MTTAASLLSSSYLLHIAVKKTFGEIGLQRKKESSTKEVKVRLSGRKSSHKSFDLR